MTIAVNRNLSNCENSPKKKKDFRGFNGIRTRGLCVSAAVLSQLSYEEPYTGGGPIYLLDLRGQKVQNKEKGHRFLHRGKPVCSGFDSRTRHHYVVEFVLGCSPCSERFFCGYSSLSLSTKTSTSNYHR